MLSHFRNTLLCCAVLAVAPAFAQDGVEGRPAQELMPAVAAVEVQDVEAAPLPMEYATHPMMRMTPDKSEMVPLEKAAYSIIVGNPVHLSVLMDSPNLLVLVPKQPGATHFTVLDSEGKVIMQRHVIVASPKTDYIRVRRSCQLAGETECQPTRVYYCPDMCHETLIPSADEKQDSKKSPEAPSSDDQQQPTVTLPVIPVNPAEETDSEGE